MSSSRRAFLATAAAPAAAALGVSSSVARQPLTGSPDFQRVRADFPWISRHLYLSAANRHPLSQYALAAAHRYLSWRTLGSGEGRSNFLPKEQAETRAMFARLINAEPEEIAFVRGTTEGENLVVAGLNLHSASGNVVVDELHWLGSKFLYRMLERQGRLKLRMVRQRNWRIDPNDVSAAVNRDTKLISIALVSNINGYLHDARAIADIAHAHGTYLYADIIQAAGAVPIDVRAAGIDFAASGTSKWLMGDYGFGFLFVRSDLHERLRPTRFGVRGFRKAMRGASQFDLVSGAARYESGSFSYGAGLCAHAALQYLRWLGVDRIRAHVRPLVARLVAELPGMGYECITPPGNESPIVSFVTPQPDVLRRKLARAFGPDVVWLDRWEFQRTGSEVSTVDGMRIAPSVYNNQSDIDRFLDALR